MRYKYTFPIPCGNYSGPTALEESTTYPPGYSTCTRYPPFRFWAALRQKYSCTDKQVPVDILQYVPSICVPFPTFRLDNPRAGPQHSAIMLRARKGDLCGEKPTRARCFLQVLSVIPHLHTRYRVPVTLRANEETFETTQTEKLDNGAI